MATTIDEQLAKAEARVKRLKQRKQLTEAKQAIAENAELKKQVAELKKQKQSVDLERELKRVKDSNAWLRGAVNNLITDVQSLRNWTANDKDKAGKEIKVTLVNRDVIISRLNGILKGQQPARKK